MSKNNMDLPPEPRAGGLLFSRKRAGRAASVRCRALLIAAFLTASCSTIVAAGDAQIVSLTGQGESRESAALAWRPAVVEQTLNAGNFVRTLDFSQMAVLLRDQTQLRLNQNSLLQIKALAGEDRPTRLELLRGRSWMQHKGGDRRSQAALPSALEIETPNAIAAIRGTDWELLVEDSGVVTLSVFSGEAEFYNPLGRVSVRANEQARVETGKAPVKLLLTSGRDRIQWVTAYRAQPVRWWREQKSAAAALAAAIESGQRGELPTRLALDPLHSVGTALVSADLLLAQGRIDEAIDLLARARKTYPEAGQVAALLARACLLGGRAAQADEILANARQRHAGEIEVWLAAGDLARYEGHAAPANAAYRRALALDADNAEAWFGLGVVASEREYVTLARDYLGEALRRDARGPGFIGEAATLETFADNFPRAAAAFAAALAAQPDDYVALTGLGLLHLKRGDTDAALTAFLKAGVIEPHYARAILYTGVAYYRQGRFVAAREMFERAAELDRRDPLPHMLLGIAASDAAMPGEAVDAARAALVRMPYLKSLNQLLNNQKGSANIGSALAAFGLEAWAQNYAHAAYNPFWAGSHLFLADRLNGTFNKNSELFQGFLSDPTVFGASNRFSSLLPRPGDYATLSAGVLRQSGKAGIVEATFNGYRNEKIPFAYFFEGDAVSVRPAAGSLNGDIGMATIGLGARPTHELGVFLFANRERLDSILTDPGNGFFGTPQEGRNGRADLGFSYRFSPDAQSWFKIGSGELRRLVDGEATDIPGSQLFSSVFPLNVFGDRGEFIYRTKVSADDWQWRHVVDVNRHWQLGFGVEHGRQSMPLLVQQYLPTDAGLFYYGTREETAHESLDYHWSNRLQLSDTFMLQFDLAQQQLKKRFRREQFFGVVDLFETPQSRESEQRFRQVNPRLGLAWQPRPGQTVRVAWQAWRRPAAQNTLAGIDTAGIALDDRLLAVGGHLQRVRAQYESELSERTFLALFADRSKIDNLLNPGGTLVSGTALDTLERLRKLFIAGQGAVDIYEATPDFSAGRVDSAGAALNHVVNSRLAVSGAYSHRQSRNTAGGASSGKAIPLLPRHLVQFGATWFPLPRLRLEALGIYRSARFVDEANSSELASGWNFSLRGGWETADKRFAAQLRAENLLSGAAAGFERKPLLGLLLIWRL